MLGDRSTVGAISNQFGDARAMPCLLIPEPLMQLILNSSWRRLIILARWHPAMNPGLDKRRCDPQGCLQNWPPRDAAVFQHVGEHEIFDEFTQTGSSFEAGAINRFGETLDRWSCDIIDASKTAEERDERLGTLRQMQDTFNYWMESLTYENSSGKFRHSSRKLLQAIKTASMLTGGAKRLQEVVARSLALALPPAFQASFLHYTASAGDELLDHDVSAELGAKIPSASLVQRYEFSLDLAISLLERVMKDADPDVARFGMADSSGMGDYNILWSMYVEIKKERLVATWQAALALKLQTEAYIKQLKAEHGDDVDDIHAV